MCAPYHSLATLCVFRVQGNISALRPQLVKMSTDMVATSVAKSSMLSSTRQQTRLFDRLRTRAVSLFLAEFRDVFLAQVPDDSQNDKEKKRKALEKIARLQFKREPDNVQRIYINSARHTESPVPLADGQDTKSLSSGDSFRSSAVLADALSSGDSLLSSGVLAESRSAGDSFRSSAVLADARSSGDSLLSSGVVAESRSSGDCLQSSSVLAVPSPAALVLPLPSCTMPHPTTLASPRSSVQSKKRKAGETNGDSPATSVANGLDAHWTDGPSALTGRFVRQCKHFRKLYGDAGALEALAAGVRISEAIDMKAWPDRVTVKLAVVAGMAAKLTQTQSDEEHVRILWARIAGKSSEPEIRKLETKVLGIWARKGLHELAPVIL